MAQQFGYLWKVNKLKTIFGGVFKFWFPGEAEQAVKVWEVCRSGKLGKIHRSEGTIYMLKKTLCPPQARKKSNTILRAIK